MEKEFNLSEKVDIWTKEGLNWYKEKDVKEFIKRLKEKISNFFFDKYFPRDINKIIDKLSGNSLTDTEAKDE